MRIHLSSTRPACLHWLGCKNTTFPMRPRQIPPLFRTFAAFYSTNPKINVSKNNSSGSSFHLPPLLAQGFRALCRTGQRGENRCPHRCHVGHGRPLSGRQRTRHGTHPRSGRPYGSVRRARRCAPTRGGRHNDLACSPRSRSRRETSGDPQSRTTEGGGSRLRERRT